MSLRSYFAEKSLKKELEGFLENVELGPLARDKGGKTAPPDVTSPWLARPHYRAAFTGVSRKDGTKIQGVAVYAPKSLRTPHSFVAQYRPMSD